MPSDRPTSAPSRHALRIGGLVALVVAGAVVVTGIATRANSNEKLKQWTMEQAVPSVSVILPSASGEVSSIQLPARFEAYSKAAIYARTNGYLKRWYADIGTRVKEGQVLADIETPDLDQKLLQARADLATAKANEALAKTTAERWVSLLDSGAVSPQEVDEKKGDYEAKQAMTKAAQANVDRLIATRGFAHIVAPFAGTVTARNTDTGALITEGGNNGPALFEVSDTRRLRLFVNVPQNYIGSIKAGTTASITVPEQPGKTYAATVESTSRAVDAASGAMLVQLIVDNKDAALLPGGYANVSLKLPSAVASLGIPSSALIFDKAGLRVATVGADGKARLKPVTLARDLGKTVELSAGVASTDRIIENPPDGIADGQEVRLAEAAGNAKSGDH